MIARRTFRTGLITFASAFAAVACGPDVAPVAPVADVSSLHTEGGAESTPLASPAWQVLAASLVAQANFNPIVSGHAYPLLGVAQYRAVQRVEARRGEWDDDGDDSERGSRSGGRVRIETDRGAVAGASAVVLTALFPTKTADINALLATQASSTGGAVDPAFTAGEAIGRAVGAEIMARASTDGFSTPANPIPPAGPGFWISNTSPSTVASGRVPGVTPWFLRTANQFRPGPPPAFGSSAFLTALAEIRSLSDSRTAEQARNAGFWAVNAGTETPTGYSLGVATDKLTHRRETSVRFATHLYA